MDQQNNIDAEERPPVADEIPAEELSVADFDQLITKQLLSSDTISKAQVRYANRVQKKLSTSDSLLDIYQKLEYVDRSQILEALRKVPTSLDIGHLLVNLGYLKEIDIRNAVNIQREKTPDKKLGQVLVDNHFLSEDKFLDLLAIQLGIPKLDPEYTKIDKTLLESITPRWCKDNQLIPVARVKDRVVIACAHPTDADVIRKAKEAFGQNVLLGIAHTKAITDTIGVFEQSNLNAKKPKILDGENTASRLVDNLLSEAIEAQASDIHLEPLSNHMRIRLRCNGVMMPHSVIKKELIASVVGRLKILAGTDITEKRKHQDGHILFKSPVTGQNVDVRASFYITIFGEKVVLRVLSNKVEMLSVDQLGLTPRATESFYQDVLDTPSGIILITGPTGSGKTTTLYSCINYLNSIERSIITAEDPVEYQLEGISQCSLNTKIGIDYASTLPAMVRQDPDVIVLGEIRDQFSAEAAIQAALTGHKVLTTFHTEDTIGGLMRLMNMNIETFLISSTLVSVLAQRLLRKICGNCAAPYTPTVRELNSIGYTKNDLVDTNLHVGKGCDRCQFSGYSGRLGVYELLVLNEKVKDAILQNKSSYKIRRISFETSKMTTLLEEGLLKAASGKTTLSEVIRHLPRLEKPRPLHELKRLTGQR